MLLFAIIHLLFSLQQNDMLAARLQEAEHQRRAELEAVQQELERLSGDQRRQQSLIEAIVRQVRGSNDKVTLCFIRSIMFSWVILP